MPFRDANVKFFENVSKAWASQRAVDFYNKYSAQIKSIFDKIALWERSFDLKATRALAILAEANGMSAGGYAEHIDYLSNDNNVYNRSSSLFYHVSLGAGNDYAIEFHDNINGVTGMNVEQVEGFINEYIIAVKTILGVFGHIPMNISMFDPSGEIQGAYMAEIQSIKKEWNDILNGLMHDIRMAMLEEKNTILLSAKQATQTMSANG